jgi:hypothetical protein
MKSFRFSSAVNKELDQAADAGGVQERDPAHIENNLIRFDLAHLLKKGADRFEAKLAIEAGDEGSIVTGLLKDIQFGRVHEVKEYSNAHLGSMNEMSQEGETEKKGGARRPRATD